MVGERKKISVTEVNRNSLTTKEKSKAVVSEEDESPVKLIFCVKTKDKIKEIEEREDCFILDFDPDDVLKSSISKNLPIFDSSSDLSVIAEKGQVACRDYPHSRHVCLKYPFGKTPHEQYCKLCYCFVCDLAAPCKKWTVTSGGHCHAIDNEAWKCERRAARKLVRIAG